MSAIRVKNFECYSWSPSMVFGKTPKVTMWCGKCGNQWAERFSPRHFQNGFPKSMCTKCDTVNYVPLKVTG